MTFLNGFEKTAGLRQVLRKIVPGRAQNDATEIIKKHRGARLLSGALPSRVHAPQDKVNAVFKKTAVSIGWADAMKTRGLATRAGIRDGSMLSSIGDWRKMQLLQALKAVNPGADGPRLEAALKGSARHFSGNAEIDKNFVDTLRTHMKGYRAHRNDVGYNKEILNSHLGVKRPQKAPLTVDETIRRYHEL